MISTLTVRNAYSTEFCRCINQIIVLLPLNKPCKVNLNGIIMTVENGLIINNSDLYQMIDLDEVVELCIPLPIFFEQDHFSSRSYFDFAQINNADQFRNLVLEILYNEAYLNNDKLHYIIDIADFLLREAKVTLHTVYIPTLRTKNVLAQKLIRHINNNIQAQITTQSVSTIFYISQSYISILFSKVLNINFKYYVTSLKIALSLFDLVQHNKPIHETAAIYNFHNVSTYSRHFKRFIHMPPKKFIQHYRNNKGTHPIEFHTSIESISNYLSKRKQHISLKNNVISNIKLNELHYNHYFEEMITLIHLNNLYELINFSESYFEDLTSTNFSKVNLYIKNANVSYLNNLELQKLLNTIQRLVNKDFNITFSISNDSIFQNIERSVISPLSKTYKKGTIFKFLTLVFNTDAWEIDSLRLTIQVLQSNYKYLNLGIIIDEIINQFPDISEIVNVIQQLSIDYFYMNLDLNSFNHLIQNKFFTSCKDLRQSLMQFISYLIPESKKLILNNITYSSLIKYFNNSISDSHILLMRLILDLNGKIAGLGYPLYATDEDQVMLIDQHQNTMPIVYIYSLIRPFVNKYTSLIPNGITSKINSDYHLLLINKNNTLTNAAPLVMSVNSDFTCDYFIFNRILNAEHGIITNMISSHLNHTFIEPDLLKQIQKSNQPLATLALHKYNVPLSFSLETSTLQYIMLSPNNQDKY